MKFLAGYASDLRRVEELTANVLQHAPAPNPNSDLYRADLAGLLSTAYVAAFECCIKSVFLTFAGSKHKILGNVAGYHFEQINSRIKLPVILDVYTAQFGAIYKAKFKELLEIEEKQVMKDHGQSLKGTYTNLINWRHAFAHSGQRIATLEEVVPSYIIAKRVISVLDSAMSV